MAYSKAYASNYDLIDWSDFKPATIAKVETEHGKGPYFVPDIAPFVSPVSRTMITSRSELREHNKRHGVFQVGSDLKPQDYTAHKPAQVNEHALERAYRLALQKVGMN